MDGNVRRFLGLGECMVELSATGEGLFRQGFAGDVFNTLWYARRALPADWSVEFHTGVGSDRMSDELIAFSEAEGIGCEGVLRVPDRTLGLYLIHLDDGERSFSYWRDTSAARRMMSDPDLVRDRVMAADVIYFSGITLAILPPADADALVDQARQARNGGRTVAFDPNIRPRLWDDSGRMRDVVSAAAAASTIVLPSHDDEAAAFGDTSPEATADRYAALGCEHVVVKNGRAAMRTVVDGESRDHPVQPVTTVVDTTAAGDSFNAAYLARFLASGDVAAAVAAGQRQAAQTISAKGALVRETSAAG